MAVSGILTFALGHASTLPLALAAVAMHVASVTLLMTSILCISTNATVFFSAGSHW